MRGKDSEATGLPLILERIAENITVSFCPNSSSSPESIVFFPEYYEWLDEISPAHIFSRSSFVLINKIIFFIRLHLLFHSLIKIKYF